MVGAEEGISVFGLGEKSSPLYDALSGQVMRALLACKHGGGLVGNDTVRIKQENSREKDERSTQGKRAVR